MGNQCQFRMCQQSDQYALPHVVSDPSISSPYPSSLISCSHASIDPKTRAERNLPEDLIRLCVGIEDPEDLIDDLEAALLEAGAVRVVDEAGSRAVLERVKPEGELLAAEMEAVTIEGAFETLTVSAPGKVILFGEHAVVHGVVRPSRSPVVRLLTRSPTDRHRWCRRPPMLLHRRVPS